VVDCAAALAPSGACDAESSLIDVLVGQLLAFFRCLELGLRPDAPSTGGVITRVVDGFAIHDGPGSCRS
jgi:tagatose-6-phosphate ketose/aldose isomerase